MDMVQVVSVASGYSHVPNGGKMESKKLVVSFFHMGDFYCLVTIPTR